MSEAGVLRGGKQEQRTQFMIGVGEKTGGKRVTGGENGGEKGDGGRKEGQEGREGREWKTGMSGRTGIICGHVC